MRFRHAFYVIRNCAVSPYFIGILILFSFFKYFQDDSPVILKDNEFSRIDTSPLDLVQDIKSKVEEVHDTVGSIKKQDEIISRRELDDTQDLFQKQKEHKELNSKEDKRKEDDVENKRNRDNNYDKNEDIDDNKKDEEGAADSADPKKTSENVPKDTKTLLDNDDPNGSIKNDTNYNVDDASLNVQLTDNGNENEDGEKKVGDKLVKEEMEQKDVLEVHNKSELSLDNDVNKNVDNSIPNNQEDKTVANDGKIRYESRQKNNDTEISAKTRAELQDNREAEESKYRKAENHRVGNILKQIDANFEKGNDSFRRGKVEQLLYVPLKFILKDNYTYCRKVETFQGPFNYSKEFKNPCWWEKNIKTNKEKLRCLSYFYIAGFSKSGTSDLNMKLQLHPQVIMETKEKHWFDLFRFTSFGDSFDKYIGQFNHLALGLARNDTDDGGKQIVTGDNTPAYAWCSIYWRCSIENRGLSEPRYTIADEIYRMNPGARIIVLMRDPVKRLFSRYLTWKYQVPGDPAYTDPSALNFHEKCRSAIESYRECFAQHSVRYCAYDGFMYGKVKLRLQESMYSVFVADWLKVFPRNQLLFMRFEDYTNDIPESMKQVVSFLDLKPLAESEYQFIGTRKATNVGVSYEKVPVMLNSTIAMLREFYSPFVKDLQGLLGEQFSWGY